MPDKYNYIGRGNQRKVIVYSKEYNVDNGAGVTDDDVVCNLPYEARVVSVRAIYTEATPGSGADSANFKIGVSAGDGSIVAATALQNSKSIGATTTATVASELLPANTTLWTRHTGVAVTVAGKYRLQIVLLPKP